jgi:hypothetical protein
MPMRNEALSALARCRMAAGPARLFAVAGCAALLTAGCGVVYSASAGSASPGATASPGSGASAYLACLRQHGISVPAAPASPAGSPSPGAGAGSGAGTGTGTGGGFQPGSAAFARALQACAALRPAGGFGGPFGGGFGPFGAALQAFRTCMAAHGEPIPATPPSTAPSGTPGPDRFLNGLNPASPKVATALKACQSKLPAFRPQISHPGNLA